MQKIIAIKLHKLIFAISYNTYNKRIVCNTLLYRQIWMDSERNGNILFLRALKLYILNVIYSLIPEIT